MRHGRQMRLAGVGEAGQKRLTAAEVSVFADGFVGEVATRYLAGAGCGTLCLKSLELEGVARAVDPAVRVIAAPSLGVQSTPDLYPWRYSAASELAAGAHLALHALRQLLVDPT